MVLSATRNTWAIAAIALIMHDVVPQGVIMMKWASRTILRRSPLGGVGGGGRWEGFGVAMTAVAMAARRRHASLLEWSRAVGGEEGVVVVVVVVVVVAALPKPLQVRLHLAQVQHAYAGPPVDGLSDAPECARVAALAPRRRPAAHEQVAVDELVQEGRDNEVTGVGSALQDGP